MKKIFNFLLTILVMWGAEKLFPNNVHFDNNMSIVITSLIMWGIGYLLFAILFPMILGGGALMSSDDNMAIGMGCMTVIMFFVIAFLSAPLKLFIADSILLGFSINGFWPYVIISVALGIFNIRSSNK